MKNATTTSNRAKSHNFYLSEAERLVRKLPLTTGKFSLAYLLGMVFVLAAALMWLPPADDLAQRFTQTMLHHVMLMHACWLLLRAFLLIQDRRQAMSLIEQPQAPDQEPK